MDIDLKCWAHHMPSRNEAHKDGPCRESASDGERQLIESSSYEEETEHASSSAADDSSSVERDERDYFGESEPSDESESSEVAWVDSDEDNELRNDYNSTAAWLRSTGLQKIIPSSLRQIKFTFSREIFAARHRIKLFKAFPDIRIAVDSFNLIYLIDASKTFKLVSFNITDFVQFSNRLLFCSASSSFLKELTPDGECRSLNKRVGNIAKLAVDGRFLYAIGDQLSCFDENLNLKQSFKCLFTDMCASNGRVVCLKTDGDLYCFDSLLRFQTRVSHPYKFRFKNIFEAHSHYFLSTDTGMCILNSALQEVRCTEGLKSEPTCFASNDSFILYGSCYENSLRIVKEGLVYHDKFPFAKISIPPLSSISMSGDTAYLCHSRFISCLRLHYAEKQ